MIRRGLWLVFGLLMTGLAIAGAVLPLLPTTPFLLLAAYGFARSSRRLHDWLLNHRHFGPLIRNWRDHGAIDRGSKITALLVMVAALALSWLMGLGWQILLTQALVLSVSAAFILSRPSGPREKAGAQRGP
ncbi:MAG: YbaN family protein [Pseudomonadota bacterium]|nr:YbaN family protein [Pseudomonadota bacterium]